jgi:glycosyltransferase involved in cell wall biosynthesis
MYKNNSISIIIPCYNEEMAIKSVLHEIPSYIDEVIVVDNNSADKTAEYASSCGAEIVYEDRRGYGFAFRKGLHRARCKIIATFDGDGTYSFSELRKLLEHLISNDLDFVIGDRLTYLDRASMKKLNYIGNLILSFILRVLYRCNIKDSQSGMWVAKNSILKEMKLISGGMSLSEEIKIRVITRPFAKFKEIPINYERRMGKSKLNIWFDGIKNILFLFTLRLKI